MDKFIKKTDHFDYTTGKIRKYINKGKGNERKGKKEYCGLCNLQTVSPFRLKKLKNPWFLLLKQMFINRRISIIDAYLNIG
jgi:hypothetical protein